MTIAAGSPGEFGSDMIESEPPSTARLVTIPASPASSSGLRPTRSTSRIASTVIATFSTPMTMFA